ncbi:hypothetical protein [Curtobacterium sp. MCBD17_040]|uniref:hypothetical protein n=1 Tax=Curtobacterium sp. MCBD17_040 TaxID=2175674 RepID=UPI000DA8B170|nr:hypothetical protein [Curtobacterium sp. MCBD17_040]WIB65757.1 hypothetical protein DEI94_16700 [Curtobacterium sp. MCBD17_040]
MSNGWFDGLPDAPGGAVGAWFNVVVCGVLTVALPVIVFVHAKPPANVLFAVAALALMVFLESVFVRKLRQQMLRRRSGRE